MKITFHPETKVFPFEDLCRKTKVSQQEYPRICVGALLFLIYVNDITEHLLSITRLFADDSSLSFSTSNLNDLEGIINHDLVVISTWAKQWLVDFNPNKTEAIFFTLREPERPLRILFDDKVISFVDDHKHLGLTLSSNGKWHTHINNILSSSSKILGIMRKLKYKVSRKSLNQIYISDMRPILEYASVVWDGCTEYEKTSLERIQYEAARIVTGLTRSASIENIQNEIGWQSLSIRRTMQKLVIMYKSIHGLTPSYVRNLLPPTVGAVTPYNLRNNHNINIPHSRLETYKRSFLPSAVRLWNDTANEIRTNDSVKKFKTSLVNSIFHQYNIPVYYIEGERYPSVMHARLRNYCSNLITIIQ